jgi:glucose-1-phosphate thymidylyltransferase
MAVDVKKGILLAGGKGSRLFPVTFAVSKQLLPVGDKPLIYYSLSVLMLAGIREIILICNEADLSSYFKLFGNGSELGLSIDYVIQPRAEGIAQAFILAEQHIAGRSVALVLGDNLFYGYGFSEMLRQAVDQNIGATVFGYRVSDPERFGVVEFDEVGNAVSIEEKPTRPRSPYAVTGLYFYDSRVVEYAKALAPSSRGELEITDLNNRYLEQGQLRVQNLGRGFAWLDTGTHEAMADAGVFINSIEARQGIKVACLEEISYRNGWIDLDGLKRRAVQLSKSEYGAYLKRLVAEVSST